MRKITIDAPARIIIALIDKLTGNIQLKGIHIAIELGRVNLVLLVT